jgi:hypothetical protein
MSGDFHLGVTTLENGGAGLTGEGTYADVVVSYTANIFGHAAGSLSQSTLSMPDAIIGYASPLASSATLTIANASGSRANLMATASPGAGSSLVGLTGGGSASGIAPGANSTAIGATLATGQGVGAYSRAFNYTFGDHSGLPGAQANVGTSSVTVQGTIFDHAAGSLSTNTLTIEAIAGYTGSVSSSETLTIDNAAGTRVNLLAVATPGVGSSLVGLSSTTRSGIGPGTSSAGIVATLAGGQAVGSFTRQFTIDFGDDSPLAGALANVGSTQLTVQGSIVEHASGTLGNFGGDVPGTVNSLALATNSTLTIDFGTVSLGAGGGQLTSTFDVIAQWVAQNPTAALELDSVMSTGDTSTISLLGPASFAALQPGNAANYLVALNTSQPGSFQAQYNFLISDEDLPGHASLGMLTVTASGTIVGTLQTVPEPIALLQWVLTATTAFVGGAILRRRRYSKK